LFDEIVEPCFTVLIEDCSSGAIADHTVVRAQEDGVEVEFDPVFQKTTK